ncbi:ATP-binding protein [Actinoplanes sp. NPDC049596]|uniref:sensor histidine kinase n=1 Tax=unclassified Actinoplanes TaxID=2626549 RepID=UPI003445C06B
MRALSKRQAWAWTAVVVVLGVLASIGAGLTLHGQQRQGFDAVMDRRAGLVAQAVTMQAARYVDTLRTTAGAISAFEELTAGKFAMTAAPLARLELAGATSLTYLVPADDRETPATQAKWRSRELPNLVLKPDRNLSRHYFAIFSERLDGTTSGGGGGDLAASAVPSAALEEARRTGDVIISAPYVLSRDRSLPEEERQSSFVLATGLWGPAREGRTRPFRGWLMMGLRSETFLGDSLGLVAQGGIDVILQTRGVDGLPAVVATLRGQTPGLRALQRTVTVPVAQRHWTLVVASPSGSVPGTKRLPAAVTLAGLLFTAALAVLVHVLATGRARAEARVVAATADLRATQVVLRQQTADLTAFAGVVAHDLKAPLATVRAHAEFLDEELDGRSAVDAAEIRPDLRKITAGVARMGTLIDDLLTYAAAREGGIKPVDLDLHALADEIAIAHLDAASAARRPLPTIYVGDLPPVAADPALVRQLLNNLIGNAVKYTAPGRTPRVDVTAHATEDGRRVVVQVADRGLGVPAGQHEAIFDGFHRAHLSSGIPGTGLGLAICHRIVERHGGVITAEDNRGGGTIITFSLPGATGVPPAPAPVVADVPQTQALI